LRPRPRVRRPRGPGLARGPQVPPFQRLRQLLPAHRNRRRLVSYLRVVRRWRHHRRCRRRALRS
jgi:hypothetical protein